MILVKKFKVVVDYNNIMSVLEVLEKHEIGWMCGQSATEYNPFKDNKYVLEKCQTIRLLYSKNKQLMWDYKDKPYKKYKSYTVGDIINERFVNDKNEISCSDDNYTIYKYEDVLAVKDKFDGNVDKQIKY